VYSGLGVATTAVFGPEEQAQVAASGGQQYVQSTPFVRQDILTYQPSTPPPPPPTTINQPPPIEQFPSLTTGTTYHPVVIPETMPAIPAPTPQPATGAKIQPSSVPGAPQPSAPAAGAALSPEQAAAIVAQPVVLPGAALPSGALTPSVSAGGVLAGVDSNTVLLAAAVLGALLLLRR
jgi:hypothetical protein